MKKLYYAVRVLRHWLLRKPLPMWTVWVTDLPDQLHSRRIYVAGEDGYLWYAAMLCPCGCSATLYMSLMPEGRPRWQVTEAQDGTITLDPSVWRTIECKSHFFLQKGLVEWCQSPRQ